MITKEEALAEGHDHRVIEACMLRVTSLLRDKDASHSGPRNPRVSLPRDGQRATSERPINERSLQILLFEYFALFRLGQYVVVGRTSHVVAAVSDPILAPETRRGRRAVSSPPGRNRRNLAVRQTRCSSTDRRGSVTNPSL